MSENTPATDQLLAPELPGSSIGKLTIWLKSPGFQKYFKSTGWLFFTRIITLGVSFFVTAYVVRTLGPANYGYLSYAVSYVSIFSFIAVLGLDQILYRDLIKFPEKANEILGTSLALRLIAGAAAALICIGSAYASSVEDVSFLLIAIISMTYIFTSFHIIQYEFQAHVESKYPSLVSLAVLLLLNALKLVIMFNGKGVIYLAFILVLEAVLTAALYIVYRHKRYGSLSQWRFSKELARKMLVDSWPLMLGSAFALIYARIDQVFIKHMIDTTAVGLYDASVKIVEAWYFVPSIIVGSLFPAIVNARQNSDEEYSKRLRHLALFLAGVSIAVAIPVTLFAPLILYVLYGSAYVAGSTVLQVYIWSGVSTALGSLAMNYLIAENFRKIILISSFAAMALNVILNILLIPEFGINGSALATLISYTAMPVSLLLFKEPRARLKSMIFGK